MVRNLCRLSAIEVKNLGAPGMYHDGGGLYLHVSETGAKSWLYRYMFHGRPRSMGLGSYTDVSLAQARDKAWDWRNTRRDGRDPLAVRDKVDEESRPFQAFGDEYIGKRKTGKAPWSDTHVKQWESTLKVYVYPVIGAIPPRQVDLPMVRKIVDPLYETMPRTAYDVRLRIEAIIDYAKACDPERDMVGRWRENPARGRGLWDKLQRPSSVLAPQENYRALDYHKVGLFIRDLRGVQSIGAKPLEFMVIEAARSHMVLGMTWNEIDFTEKVWTLSAKRMKNRKEFRQPLTEPALVLLEEAKKHQDGPYVFPGENPGTPVSRVGLHLMLKGMSWHDQTTVHGFRSVFSTWAAEETNFPIDIREMALAHKVGNDAYEAYQRGDLLRKRRRLMEAWAKYVATATKRTELLAAAA